MNLLMEFIPDYSGHIKSIEFNKPEGTLEIIFYDRPEEFNPVVKLIFTNVTDYSFEIFEELEPNDIDLAIGFDHTTSGYYLHTYARGINFNASKVVKIDMNSS